MATRTYALILTLLYVCSLSAQKRTRQDVFDRSAPSVEVGRALLPGLLCVIGGAMNTETARGKIAQQGLFLTAGIAIGGWDRRNKKKVLIRLGCGLAGAAIGYAIRPK